MDYIVYGPNTVMVSRHHTEREAKDAALALKTRWAQSGAPRIPNYRVCYNGSKSTVIFDTNNPTNLPMTAEQRYKNGIPD